MEKQEYLRRVAYSIKKHRTAKNITQSDLAKKLGTNHTFIVRLEKGNQNTGIYTLYKTAEVMGVELSELLSL